MSRVFVIQEQAKFDMSPARKYGAIKTILPAGDTNFSYNFVVEKLIAAFIDIEPDDYILLSGDPVAIGLATAIAFQMSEVNAPLNFLKWMPRELQYLPITVNIDEIQEGLNG